MEEATSLDEVFRELEYTYKWAKEVGPSERLMFYDLIPKSLVDVSSNLQKFREAVKYSSDIPAGVEIIYLLELENKLGKSISLSRTTIKYRRMIRQQFLNVILSWREMVMSNLNITESELLHQDKISSELVVSLEERMADLAKALLIGMSDQQKARLVKKEREYLKYNKHQQRLALRKNAKGLDGMDVAAGIGGALFGVPATVIQGMLAVGDPASLLHPISLIAIAADLSLARLLYSSYKVKPALADPIKSTHKLLETLLDPFFEPIREAASCARATKTHSK